MYVVVYVVIQRSEAKDGQQDKLDGPACRAGRGGRRAGGSGPL